MTPTPASTSSVAVPPGAAPTWHWPEDLGLGDEDDEGVMFAPLPDLVLPEQLADSDDGRTRQKPTHSGQSEDPEPILGHAIE